MKKAWERVQLFNLILTERRKIARRHLCHHHCGGDLTIYQKDETSRTYIFISVRPPDYNLFAVNANR